MIKSKTEKMTSLFLESLSTEKSKESFDYLVQLVDILENKIDPEPTEIRLLDNIYHFLENFKNLEYNLRSYVKEMNLSLPGNKLSSLYDDNLPYGTTNLFKE